MGATDIYFEEYEERIAELTDMLASVLAALEVRGEIDLVAMRPTIAWYRRYLAEEAESAKRAEVEARALAKLTPEERRALGLRERP